MACYIPRWYTRPKTVTHPDTNRARRALTSFVRRTPLTTTPRRQPIVCQAVGINLTGVCKTQVQIVDGEHDNDDGVCGDRGDGRRSRALRCLLSPGPRPLPVARRHRLLLDDPQLVGELRQRRRQPVVDDVGGGLCDREASVGPRRQRQRAGRRGGGAGDATASCGKWRRRRRRGHAVVGVVCGILATRRRSCKLLPAAAAAAAAALQHGVVDRTELRLGRTRQRVQCRTSVAVRRRRSVDRSINQSIKMSIFVAALERN